jgi:hypothetical protein
VREVDSYGEEEVKHHIEPSAGIIGNEEPSEKEI